MRPVDGSGYQSTETASAMDQAVADGAGVPVFERKWPGAGAHGHVFRLMRIVFPQWDNDEGYYIEVAEPGACGCLRRVDLSRLVHAVMNLGTEGIAGAERRAVCACGHAHRFEAAAGASRIARLWSALRACIAGLFSRRAERARAAVIALAASKAAAERGVVFHFESKE